MGGGGWKAGGRLHLLVGLFGAPTYVSVQEVLVIGPDKPGGQQETSF